MDNDQNQEYFIDPWGKLVYITKTRKKLQHFEKSKLDYV